MSNPFKMDDLGVTEYLKIDRLDQIRLGQIHQIRLDQIRLDQIRLDLDRQIDRQTDRQIDGWENCGWVNIQQKHPMIHRIIGGSHPIDGLLFGNSWFKSVTVCYPIIAYYLPPQNPIIPTYSHVIHFLCFYPILLWMVAKSCIINRMFFPPTR